MGVRLRLIWQQGCADLDRLWALSVQLQLQQRGGVQPWQAQGHIAGSLVEQIWEAVLPLPMVCLVQSVVSDLEVAQLLQLGLVVHNLTCIRQS